MLQSCCDLMNEYGEGCVPFTNYVKTERENLIRFSESTYCGDRRYLRGQPLASGLPPQIADITFYL